LLASAEGKITKSPVSASTILPGFALNLFLLQRIDQFDRRRKAHCAAVMFMA